MLDTKQKFSDITAKIIILLLSGLIGLGAFLITRSFENRAYTDRCAAEITGKVANNAIEIAVLKNQYSTVLEALKRIESKVDRNYNEDIRK